MAERAGSSVGRARYNEILFQLCGEILRQAPPSRQPPIVRAGAAVGLELLDLLLNPDHVLRVTEELTLRNGLMLERQVQVDISLDRLSRQQEEGAAQLSALISDRVGLDATGHVGGGRLWMPLDTVPNPVSVPVEVMAMDGTPLPRPPQREVRRALDAALWHVLRESLRTHPDFDKDGKPVNRVMRTDNTALWLVQRVLLEVSREHPGSPACHRREELVREALPGVELGQVAGEERRAALGALARTVTCPAREQALLMVRDALADDGPFLDLLRLVHRHYFVVVGLDREVRDHSVRFDLPESEALDGSVITRPFVSARRSVDFREHNHTMHVWVPLPDNVRQYSLPVRTPVANGVRSSSEVSLIGAIHFDDHPGRRAIDALLTCADELDANVASCRTGSRVVARLGDPQSSEPDARASRAGFVARRAATAVDALQAIVDQQDDAANEVNERWGRASTRTVEQAIKKLQKVTTRARQQLGRARRRLDAVASAAQSGGLRPKRLRRATKALRAAVADVERPLLRTRLVSNELAGQDVARIRLGHPTLVAESGPRPRELEVWATVNDEAVPYTLSTVGPPFILWLFVYLTGSLLFDDWAWVWPWHHLDLMRVVTETGGADAVVAVLLLIPAFAVTQFRVPDRWSVAGRLRRPARLFVMAAILVLGVAAMVVATQVGAAFPEAEGGHPFLVLATFRSTWVFFLLWTVWAVTAAALRHRYAWRPKGLKSYFGAETLVRAVPPTPRLLRLRRRIAAVVPWLVRLLRFLKYDSKEPDAMFDLRLPTRSFPSHPPRRAASRGRS